jgi:hypothetical protein
MVQGCRRCCGRTGACRKIGLVMWKNLLLRKRHWIILLLEIVLPILYIFATSYSSSLVDDGGQERRDLADNSINVTDPARPSPSPSVPTSIIDSVRFQFFNSLLVLVLLVAEVFN